MADVEIIATNVFINFPAKAEEESFLGAVNAVIGVVANVFQVVTVLVPLIENALSESADVTTEIQQTLNDTLQVVVASGITVKMLNLTNSETAAQVYLNVLLIEGPTGKDVDEPSSFQGAQLFAYLFADDSYWIRPYLADSAFYDDWFPNNGQPTTVLYDYSIFVFDPQLSMPYFATAINIFTLVAAIFHPNDPETVQLYFTDLATILERNYQTCVQGLMMVPIPSPSLLRYMAQLNRTKPIATNGQSLPYGISEGLPQTLWHGEIGAADIYSIFGGAAGYASSLQGALFVATANPGNIIDVYPTLFTLLSLFFDALGGFDAIPYPYPWFYVRMRLGNLTRFKALYFVKGYNQVWSLIQKLRFLSAGQPGTPVYGFGAAPAPEATDSNAHWRLSEIDAIFGELPVSYETWGPASVPPTASNPKGLPPVTAETVIQRLRGVLDNSTNYPIEEPPSIASTQPRPLSLRKTIIALAF